MAEDIQKREYHAFLSHSSVDKPIVDKLYKWLTETAGFTIWYDRSGFTASSQMASALPGHISKCRALITVISASSIESGWVEKEINFAIAEQNDFRDFNIIPIRIDSTPPPGFLKTYLYFSLDNGELTPDAAEQLIDALYGKFIQRNIRLKKDVYLSRSWRTTDAGPADIITKKLISATEYRLIGDSPDQPSLSRSGDVDRIQSIISSCGSMVAVLPDRGNGTTSEYILKEIECAAKGNVPVFVFREESTAFNLNAELVRVINKEQRDAAFFDNLVNDLLDRLSEYYRPPQNPYYVFWGSSFDNLELNQRVERIIEKVTGLPCYRGDEIQEEGVQKTLVKLIRNAFFMIADITGDNLNTSIECGIARGSDTRLFLFASSPRKSPAFMFRDMEVFYYDNEVDLIGKIHKIIRPYRRRVFNLEGSK